MFPDFDHGGILSRRKTPLKRVKVVLHGASLVGGEVVFIDEAVNPNDVNTQPRNMPGMYVKRIQIDVQRDDGQWIPTAYAPSYGSYLEGLGTEYIGSFLVFFTADDRMIITWTYGTKPDMACSCNHDEFGC